MPRARCRCGRPRARPGRRAEESGATPIGCSRTSAFGVKGDAFNLTHPPAAGQLARPSTFSPTEPHPRRPVSTPEPHTAEIQSPRLRIQPLRPGDEARLDAVFAAAPDWHAATG